MGVSNKQVIDKSTIDISRLANYNGKHDICINCKFIAQADGCCRCVNPNQKSKAKAEYVYWPFTCSLFTLGNRLTEIEMKELGYTKKVKEQKSKSGVVLNYEYYEK